MRKLVYEKISYKKLYKYFNDKLFPSQCRFRNDVLRASQHKLLVMAEKFKESRDKASTVGDFLTYQKLLIALIPHF